MDDPGLFDLLFIPRDEIVLFGGLDIWGFGESDDDEEVVDLSGLYDDDGTIDDGITSGADPSGWDPIGVE